MFIDTHAHLFYPNFNNEVEEVIKRAVEEGVDYIIVPGTDIASSAQAVELADKHEAIYASAGIHPHDTANWEDSLIDNIREIAKHPKVVAIGEIGLDYYYDFSPKNIQKIAFKKQIELALELSLPIIVHNRESNDDVMEIIRSYKGKNLKGQFHCFAGSVQDAHELIEMGHMISFPGNITFKKADNIRKVLAGINFSNLLLETDSPFMTPVPHRGKRNEPSYVKFVAEKISEIHNVTVKEVAEITSKNAINFFGLNNR